MIGNRRRESKAETERGCWREGGWKRQPAFRNVEVTTPVYLTSQGFFFFFFLHQSVTTLHIKSGTLSVPRSILHVLPTSYLFQLFSLLDPCTVLCPVVLKASKGTKLLPSSGFSYRVFSLHGSSAHPLTPNPTLPGRLPFI